MAFDLNKHLIKGKVKRPYRMVLYGPPAIGKSSFAATLENALFLDFEDGLNNLDVQKTPRIESYEMFMDILDQVQGAQHPFTHLVLDTADWAEPVVADFVCKKLGVTNLADVGYGKGYRHEEDTWRGILNRLERIRNERNIAIVILAHSDIKKIELPDLDPFDRYVMRLNSRVQDLIHDWVDAILFANYKVTLRKGESGKTKAIGTGERIVHTTERPAFLAKNRVGLPENLPLDIKEFEKHFYGGN